MEKYPKHIRQYTNDRLTDRDPQTSTTELTKTGDLQKIIQEVKNDPDIQQAINLLESEW